MSATLWTKPYESRRVFVGGSDVRIIMGNDETALVRLWREKRGEAEPQDYSDNLIVQLGVATEPLNRRWYEKATGRVIKDVQTWVRHPVISWMAATLDSMESGRTPFNQGAGGAGAAARFESLPPCYCNTQPNYLWRCRQNYRRLFFKFNANAISRRSASERDGLSGCFAAHPSTLSLSAGDSLIGIVSP
jgi:YqaJ-like viral recombinase domain